MAARSVFDLDRNDVPGCVEFYETNGVTPIQLRTMLMLQDDPSELLRISKDWRPSTPDGAR